MWWIAAGILAVGALAGGPLVSNVEQAKYELVESQDKIEIRNYSPMIVAEVEVSGERKEAINKGFRLIADYIFGNNTTKENVAMTSPVIQETSQKIAMTSPVTQEGTEGKWKERFVMPASYTIDNLPKPNNTEVNLKNIPNKYFVVIRFSGLASQENLKENTDLLNAFIKEKNFKPISNETYAFYNPPWTIPILRRNEVMIEIEYTKHLD
ncbi:MAG: heme-binding protein [Leptospira sp.]|nr:heme-binding protein [Leptospira sp.]